MLMKRSFSLVALLAVAALAAGRPSVATFSKDDAARAFGASCGVGPKGKIRLHRNPAGNMLTLVAERQAEGVFYAQDQKCNQLQDDVLDIWRKDDGTVAAQLIDRGDGVRLLVGQQAELRGKRFDVERTGQYLVISQGTTSTLSAIAKPYLKMSEVSLDAQRLFPRQGALLIIGDNAATGQLEGRTVRITPTGLVEEPMPIQIAGMPAGIRVLDYAEDTDDLLLAGLDASGQASFVVVNLATGRASTIQPTKPGDDMALFIGDEMVRERLTGTRAAAQGSSTGGGSSSSRPGSQGQGQGQPKSEKKGWFRF